MKKQTATDPGKPELARKVQARRGTPAKAGYPRQAKVEIGRVWLPKKAAARPTFRILRGKSAVVLELPVRLAGIEPPNIKAERLTADRFRKLNIRNCEDGYYPAHLPLTFKPKLIERVRPRQIRRGDDLPNFVFPPDTRYIFRDTSFPWCTTGKVETAGGSCTGTMIGRRLMLTGSHCMQWLRDGAGWVKFTPAYYNGTAPFGVAWAERVIYWSRVDGSDGISDQETAFDYVVIVLDRNMGDLTGYAGYRTYSSSWNGGNYWQQIGYPGDLSSTQRPAFFGGGAISSVQSRSMSGQTGYVLGHFMDTSPGHSGGPYWGWWDDEPWPRVVGTDSTSPSRPSNDTSGDNEAGGGPALSSLIAYARTTYP